MLIQIINQINKTKEIPAKNLKQIYWDGGEAGF